MVSTGPNVIELNLYDNNDEIYKKMIRGFDSANKTGQKFEFPTLIGNYIKNA